MHIKMSSAICFNLDQSQNLSSGNGLMASPLFSLIFHTLSDSIHVNTVLFDCLHVMDILPKLC